MEAEAIRAFFSHIANLNILPVAWPNTDQAEEVIENEPMHIRLAVLNTRPEVIKTCGKSRHMWILQVSIYFKKDAGLFVPAQKVDSVVSGVPFNTVLSSGGYTFKTTSQGEVIPAVNSDAWLFIPVQFRFTTYK